MQIHETAAYPPTSEDAFDGDWVWACAYRQERWIQKGWGIVAQKPGFYRHWVRPQKLPPAPVEPS